MSKKKLKKKIEKLKYNLELAQYRIKNQERTFDLRWKADQRAIKMWHEENPNKEYIWPDRADMVVFLLHKLDETDFFKQFPNAARIK